MTGWKASPFPGPGGDRGRLSGAAFMLWIGSVACERVCSGLLLKAQEGKDAPRDLCTGS